MRISHGVGPSCVSQDMLSNINAGHFIQMGCCGVTKQMGMQFFLNAGLIGNGSEDILESAL